MPISVSFIKRLESVSPELRQVLLDLLEEVERQREESVTRREFNELKEIVRELAQRVNELAEAQRRTEEEIRKLAQGQRRLRQEVGGLARSVAYALENEAFRRLPEFLRTKGIEVLERMVRREVAGEEINLFGRARRDGEELLLVGEAVLRLDDTSKLRRLKEKAAYAEAHEVLVNTLEQEGLFHLLHSL
mgnify:CR=1 FL=1